MHSGLDVSILPRNLLLGVPPDTHVTAALHHPFGVNVVGGATLDCRKRIALDIRGRTAGEHQK